MLSSRAAAWDLANARLNYTNPLFLEAQAPADIIPVVVLLVAAAL
jgi:hypothetical protein